MPSRITVYPGPGPPRLSSPEIPAVRGEDYRRWERAAPMELWQLTSSAVSWFMYGTERKVVTTVYDHFRVLRD
jgi:hypothetical protein